MIEKIQDIFTDIKQPFTITCITTNGIVKNDGKAVMGAGVAKLIRDKYIGCDEILGKLITVRGNIVQQFLRIPVELLAFPTKYHFKDNSDLKLIEKSAIELKKWSDNNPQYKKIILPRPGCNNGGLKWEEVKPILSKVLTEDKFIVITNE